MALQGVTFKDAAIVIYLVMFVVMAALVWVHAGGDRRYRTLFSVVLGLFWPLPVAILIYLYIHGMLNSIINWFDRNFN
jgi:hypothetical protein